MIDHEAEAIRLLDQSVIAHVADSERAVIVARAQVHATLHLASEITALLAQKGANQ